MATLPSSSCLEHVASTESRPPFVLPRQGNSVYYLLLVLLFVNFEIVNSAWFFFKKKREEVYWCMWLPATTTWRLTSGDGKLPSGSVKSALLLVAPADAGRQSLAFW